MTTSSHTARATLRGESPVKHAVHRLDARAFRNVLGVFPTGVAVVTALSRSGVPMGITINSFASVSIDPPLVLWSQANTSPTHDEFRSASRMVINILSHTQREVSSQFSRAQEDKFLGIDWEPSTCGTPVLRGCAATLFTRASMHYHGGDHTIHVCEVDAFQQTDQLPLLFCKGQYMNLPQSLPN